MDDIDLKEIIEDTKTTTDEKAEAISAVIDDAVAEVVTARIDAEAKVDDLSQQLADNQAAIDAALLAVTAPTEENIAAARELIEKTKLDDKSKRVLDKQQTIERLQGEIDELQGVEKPQLAFDKFKPKPRGNIDN